MTNRPRFAALAVLGALSGAACAHHPASPPAAAASSGGPAQAQAAPQAQLHKLFDDYYEETLVMDPLTASLMGDHRFDDRMAIDISDEYRARMADMCRRYLARLAAVAPAELDAEDRLSHELLRRTLSDRLEGLQFPEHLLALTHISGQPVDFPVMGAGAGVHPFETTADFDHFLRRTDDFVVWMDTAIANLRRGVAMGVVHPRLVVERLLPELDAMIVDDPSKSVFLEPLHHAPPSMSAADRARLEAAYRAAIRDKIVPAYRRLRTYLAAEYLPHTRSTVALESLPNGKAWYAYRVRASTTTSRTPDEIFALGEAEVARIDKELRAVCAAAGWKGDVASFARAQAAAPGGLKTRDGFVAAYNDLRGKVTAALPTMFGRLPRAGFEIRAIEPFREDSAPSQYQQPSPDGKRPGIFFVNAANITAGKPMRVSETLFLHEAVPGHHFQIALQYENGDVPRFRRFLDYTAYVEGWALYAESLGYKLGLYENAAQQVEHLGDEMLRAVRLVVDTGLHHRGWTREQAVAYFLAHVVSTTEDVAATASREVDRYIAWPGQALAYKTGQLKLVELRARAAKALGARFDVRAFHDEVLREGPLPLEVLEARIDAWIASQGAVDRAG
jgi:uncharacterized protein (DUF885 family)